MEQEQKPMGSCKSCTLYLMRKCYARKWWFPVLREPLLLGMRILARWHGINVRNYAAKNPHCKGCIRFMKNELQQQSPLFNKLNHFIGPRFKKLAGSALTDEEKAEALKLARQHMGKPPLHH